MAKFDLSNITLSTVEQSGLNEAIFKEVMQIPEISGLMRVFSGEVFNRQVPVIGNGGLLGKKGFGCSPSADNYNVPVTPLTWTPRGWSSRLELCFEDFENILTAHLMKTGVDRADLTNTQIMEVLADSIEQSLKEFVYRVVYFNDTAITSSQLATGVGTDYFNIIDGIFKQIRTQVTTNAKQRVSISENTAGTGGSSTAITPSAAAGYLKDMFFNAPIELRAMNDLVFVVTQSVYDAYYQSLASVGQLESMLSNFVNGQSGLKFNGVDVVAMPVWDKIIGTYLKGADPHRAILTSKSVMGIAVDNANSFETFKAWFNQDERKVKIDVAGMIDAKIMQPELFVAAY